MRRPNPKQINWLLVDLCEKRGFSMALRDRARFEALVEEGPDLFADAVLAAEGIRLEEEKQMRREIRAFVAARFAQGKEGAVS
jgi:hypothetical protein